MKRDISIAVLVLSTTVIFILGMAYWPYIPKNSGMMNKLYYITTSSVLYILSVIINMMATSKWVKICSYVGMAVFSVNLYVELFLDPQNWTKWSVGLLIAVPLNVFIMAIIIEKLKQKRNG